MNCTLRFAGLVLASLTISTVAMAQQDGGGRGGDGSGNGGNSGDTSVLEVLRQDHERARLTRARRSANDCVTAVCEQQPGTQEPSRNRIAQFNATCGGGELLILRRADGRTIRYVCRNQ